MKHLSFTSRCMIEKYIAYGYSFREIANELGYQPSTISREVKNIEHLYSLKQHVVHILVNAKEKLLQYSKLY